MAPSISWSTMARDVPSGPAGPEKGTETRRRPVSRLEIRSRGRMPSIRPFRGTNDQVQSQDPLLVLLLDQLVVRATPAEAGRQPFLQHVQQVGRGERHSLPAQLLEAADLGDMVLQPDATERAVTASAPQ